MRICTSAARGGAADDAVVNQHDPLALNRRPVGVVLQLHAEMPDFVRGFDEGPSDIMITNNPQLKRQAGSLGVTDRRWDTAVRNWDDDVGGGRVFRGEFSADPFPDLVHALLFDQTVGPREIDIFKDAKTGWPGRKQLPALDAVLGDDHHFAGFDVTYEICAHDIQRAGLRRQDHRPVKLAQDQRPHAERVAYPQQHVGSHGNQRVSALNVL